MHSFASLVLWVLVSVLCWPPLCQTATVVVKGPEPRILLGGDTVISQANGSLVLPNVTFQTPGAAFPPSFTAQPFTINVTARLDGTTVKATVWSSRPLFTREVLFLGSSLNDLQYILAPYNCSYKYSADVDPWIDGIMAAANASEATIRVSAMDFYGNTRHQNVTFAFQLCPANKTVRRFFNMGGSAYATKSTPTNVDYTGSFTQVARVRQVSTSGDRFLFGKGTVADTQQLLHNGFRGGNMYFGLFADDMASPSDPDTSDWAVYFWVFRGSDFFFEMYRNNEQLDSKTAGGALSHTDSLAIFGTFLNFDRFIGHVNEVRSYSYVLSPENRRDVIAGNYTNTTGLDILIDMSTPPDQLWNSAPDNSYAFTISNENTMKTYRAFECV